MGEGFEGGGGGKEGLTAPSWDSLMTNCLAEKNIRIFLCPTL